MTIKDKKIKLKQMKSLLKKAWSISNKLIGDEESYSNNQYRLQQTRTDIEVIQVRLDYIDYKDKSASA